MATVKPHIRFTIIPVAQWAIGRLELYTVTHWGCSAYSIIKVGVYSNYTDGYGIMWKK